MQPEQQSDGRNFYRTTAKLTVRYGPDTAEARRAMAVDEELWRTQSNLEQAARNVLEMEGSAASDDATLTVLRWLDFKLDLILYHLRLSQHELHFPYVTHTTDISGSGMGLADPQGLAVGDTILFVLELPDAPYRAIYGSAKVIWLKENPKPGEAPCAVQLVDISEVDRERIVRFTFQQQRRELAKRNEEAVDQEVVE